MRVLLSAVGTRGDVQPIFAVALRVRELGHEARLCVPPNFVAEARGLGFDARPVGVEMRLPTGRTTPLTAEEIAQVRASLPDLVTDQFDAIGGAADGCDAILGANAHQYAARSIAERRGVPYHVAVYAPVALPSPAHAPPPAPGQAWITNGDAATNDALWRAERASWNTRALERVNTNRARLGLAPIDDVLGHNLGDVTWLAADEALAPIPATPGRRVSATGAWVWQVDMPLPDALEAFLAAGEAPIYFGFGSMPAPPGAGTALVEAARATGRRAIVARGWAGLDAADDGDAVMTIGDVHHPALFPRVAAIVHHGGAGTTAAAARAGTPQVVVPMFGDQFYWAARVTALGLGRAHTGPLTGLAPTLAASLEPAVADRARAMADQLDDGGALRMARRLVEAD